MHVADAGSTYSRFFADSLALAGFSVLFVVDPDARHSMASDAAAPNVSNAIRVGRIAVCYRWLLALGYRAGILGIRREKLMADVGILNDPPAGRLREEVGDFYRQLPPWFVFVFGLAYLSGYQIESLYYSSLGIGDVAGEILKLKYVQTGMVFLFSCALVTAFATLLAVAPFLNMGLENAPLGSPLAEALSGRPRLSRVFGAAIRVTRWIGGVSRTNATLSAAPDEPPQTGRYVTRWNVLVAWADILIIYVAVTFTPLRYFQHTAQLLGLTVLIIALVLYVVFLRRTESQYDDQYGAARRDATTGKFLPGEAERLWIQWRIHVGNRGWATIVLFLAVALAAVGVLRSKSAALRDFAWPGGVIYVLLTLLIPAFGAQIIYRLAWIKRIVDREPEGRTLRHFLIFGAIGVLSLLIFFLVLTSYAYNVFPFIPVSKGGGDYENAPLASVIWKGEEKGKQLDSKDLKDTILLYTNSSSYYFAKPKKESNPCHWRTGSGRPRIVELSRDEVRALFFGPEPEAIHSNCS
jgi:hypothetical protein